MNKADARIETIFAHAVAMDQSGRLRNTIFIREKAVYILNQDNTVLLRFMLPAGAQFGSDVSFKACDYDSPKFSDREGLIVFEKTDGDMVRKKSCSTPGQTPAEVEAAFQKFPPLKANQITLNKLVIGLLNENLSHIEISGKGGNVSIVQRNIYDGTRIEIGRNERYYAKGFGVNSKDKISSDFGPVGLRTNDFAALFAFNDAVTFTFSDAKPEECTYCRVSGRNFKMTGVIALCVYDELGEITNCKTKEDDHGRQKQEGSRRKSRPNPQTEKRQSRRRRRE